MVGLADHAYMVPVDPPYIAGNVPPCYTRTRIRIVAGRAGSMVEGFDILGPWLHGGRRLDLRRELPGGRRQSAGPPAGAAGRRVDGHGPVAAARMGARCRYAGSLGSDELSRFVSGVQEEGIGLEHLDRRDDARPVHSVIIVAESRHTRTIFFDPNGAGRGGSTGRRTR